MIRVLLFVAVLATAGAASAQDTVVLERKPQQSAQAKAMQAQANRLSILQQELASIKAELTAEQAKKTPDADNVARLMRNLTALQREIELAVKTPVPSTTFAAAGRPAQPRNTPAKSAGSSSPDNQADDGEETIATVEYEGWDIFRNFGKRKEVKK